MNQCPARRPAAPRSRTVGCAAIVAILMLLAIWTPPAAAHSTRENYVWVNAETDHLSGRFELHVNDLKNKLDIDPDALGADRLEGAQRSANEVQQYLARHFAIIKDGKALPLTFGPVSLFEDAPDFVQYPYRTAATSPGDDVTIRNSVFMAPEMMQADRLHRSVLVVEYNKRVGKNFGGETVALVFTPTRTEQTLNLADPPGILTLKDFKRQGVLHILGGIDHVLFLVVLLLTSVLTLVAGRWQPQPRLLPAAINILVVVTAFAVAHSLTFSLAALSYLQPNTALIETVIALSIIAVALNNLFPRYAAHSWVLVFVFGLFHGLGFASAMSSLQYRNVLIKRILLDFNIGVELGQLALVLVLFPILYLLRRWPRYHQAIVVPFSALAIVISIYWVMERTGLVAP